VRSCGRKKNKRGGGVVRREGGREEGRTRKRCAGTLQKAVSAAVRGKGRGRGFDADGGFDPYAGKGAEKSGVIHILLIEEKTEKISILGRRKGGPNRSAGKAEVCTE